MASFGSAWGNTTNTILYPTLRVRYNIKYVHATVRVHRMLRCIGTLVVTFEDYRVLLQSVVLTFWSGCRSKTSLHRKASLETPTVSMATPTYCPPGTLGTCRNPATAAAYGPPTATTTQTRNEKKQGKKKGHENNRCKRNGR